MKEQKDAHGKVSMESANRYENLQQKYKALQEQHNNVKEEYTKKKNLQGEEINGLERKAKSLTKETETWKVSCLDSLIDDLEHDFLLFLRAISFINTDYNSHPLPVVICDDNKRVIVMMSRTIVLNVVFVLAEKD